jgi:hypothetical protein
MEAEFSPKTFMTIYQTMRCCILEDGLFVVTAVRTLNLTYWSDITFEKVSVAHRNSEVLLIVLAFMNSFISHMLYNESTVKLCLLSPWASYTDRATAACRRS